MYQLVSEFPDIWGVFINFARIKLKDYRVKIKLYKSYTLFISYIYISYLYTYKM